jgi:hypothetical protein
MKAARILFLVLLLGSTATWLRASGPLGIYGIIERVVFEQGANGPERIQLWGAFAFVDGGVEAARGTTEAARGYLYLRMPGPGETLLTEDIEEIVRAEWADLASVAGTGQAVAFGDYRYSGGFDAATTSDPPYILALAPGGGLSTDLRVRPATETPEEPAIYNTNVGIVELDEAGSHRGIVAGLRALLD